jgi:CubicO group peptidase (beta-lactamase class C family)
MNQKFLLTVKLIALLLCINNLSVDCQTTEQQIDQIFAQWDNPQIPGVSVAIVKDGKIVFKKGYGSANLEYNIPNNPSTVFDIASVSKQFTAFAILLLEEQGKLTLDDDIRKYIPEFPDFGKIMTIRHLLHHTSGIRDEMDMLCMAGWRNEDAITHEQIVNMACRQKELNFPPGNEYLYSNTNYTLLAEIVARISGRSFADFINEHIFKPLGMTSSLVYDNYERIVSNLAYSYYQDNSGYKKNVLTSSSVGSTNILTTVEDLSLWTLNFEKPLVGNINLIQKMNEGGTLNNGDKLTYALGQDVIKYNGLTIINHNGATAGYRSMLARFPEQKFSVILLSNNASFDPQSAAIKIAGLYLKEQYIEETPTEAAPAPAGEKELAGDPEILASYVGKYELRPEFIINITADKSYLFVEAHEVPYTRLVQVSQTEFDLPAMHAKLTFAKDNSGEFNQINILLNDQPMTARKIKSVDLAYINPDDYNGSFYSPELGTVYNFVTKEGQLIARHVRLGDFPMKPVNPDQFSTEKWFLKRVEFIRDEKNSVTGCIASGGRITNIRFEKIE